MEETQETPSKAVTPGSSVKKATRYMNQHVSEEEINAVINAPNMQSETSVIELWRKYITQKAREEGEEGQFKAMELMIRSYGESTIFNKNRFYSEVWIKYVRVMAAF